jgi:lipoprotein NlpI/predicted aspartyl protease
LGANPSDGARGGWLIGTLAATLVVALAPPLRAAEPPQCKLVRIAEWPVRLEPFGMPVVEGVLNGNKISVLLDTGASSGLITKSAAERLGLDAWMTSERLIGFGGETNVMAAWIDELRIGDVTQKRTRVRVAGERPIPGVDLVLGDDFFNKFDIEFEYAKRVMRVFQPIDCKNVSLSYWDRAAPQLPMENESRIVVPIFVNGREGRALLDSGAAGTVVDLSFAAKVGITPQSPGVVSSHCSAGIGADDVHSWVARFDSVALAEETIRDPRLRIADLWAELRAGRDRPPDVILGSDFLRAHRVLVSRIQRRVYFSYTGGLIFPTTPAADCDDRFRGKDMQEALAAYDRAIAANPGDTKALLSRAELRQRRNDPQGAVADLDAVIRLEPNNAPALSMRALARAGLKDYDGALADADAAIANGMRTAQMYVRRAGVRRAMRDYARAIDELGEALKLDPTHQGALTARGHHLFYAGRFEAAENDLATLLAMRPYGFDSVWLSLSRTRRGLDGRPALEQGLAKLKEGEWPAPILMYLLGRVDREALMAAAGADEKKRKGQECEARFYSALRFIADGQAKDARALLEAARDDCPRTYVEYEGAVIELEKLR